MYRWGLKQKMNKWKQTVELFYFGGGWVAIILFFEQFSIFFSSQDSVHKRAHRRWRTESFSTSLSWKVKNPASSVESNLKGHVNPASSILQGKDCGPERSRGRSRGIARGGGRSPCLHLSLRLFLPNYSASLNKTTFNYFIVNFYL